MPKLPRGMVLKGRSYWARDRRGGKDRWINLGRDRQVALQAFRKLKGGRCAPSTVTVSLAAQEWLETRVRIGRNPKNLRLARARVEMYLDEFLGLLKVSSLRPSDLRRYRVWLEEQDMSQATVAHVFGDARSFLLWCVQEELLERSPFRRDVFPRLQEYKPVRLPDETLAAIARVDDPHGFVCRFLLGTGLRWGEACRAQASDVEQGVLVVHRHTKTGRNRRIPLSAVLRAELSVRVGRLVPFGEKNSRDFARTVRRRAGVSFRVKDLRSTFACLWVERGGSLQALKSLLGHSTIVTTMRYADIGDDMLAREVDRVSRVG